MEEYANKIIEKIERGESGHKEEEDQVKKRKEKLKEAFDSTEYKS